MIERAIANTGDLFWGSSTLALRPYLQHYEGFSLQNRSHRITRCRNTYKRVHTRTALDSLVPLLFPQEQHTQACKLAEAAPLKWALTRTRNTANPQVRLLKVQRWKLWWSQHFDHLKSSHNKDLYRIDIAMDSSSVCEKTRIEVVVENTRNHFLKTLDKLSFWMEIFGSKTSGDKQLIE